ncbi:MAG: hypothetical protein PVG01_02790 [Desulfobacterales bacterium]|jgi:hypothetical protein
MVSVYIRLQKRARQIVSRYPSPDFYTDFSRAFGLSRATFDTHPVISDLRFFVAQRLENDFGHGLLHATKVALDAGCLVIAEGEHIGYSPRLIKRLLVVVQSAALLHDLKRKEPDHAVRGASFAAILLGDYPFSIEEREDVRLAILDHEAFKKRVPINSRRGALVSDSLYDADKFRWGPDNFTDTLWHMVLFQNPPFEDFVVNFPKGLQSLLKIRETFRTVTGRLYGPRFIDIGIAVGEELFEVIKTEFLPPT